MINVLVTGAAGFIGQNLCSRLEQEGGINLIKFTRQNSDTQLEEFIKKADFIFHLAAVMRPENEEDFDINNVSLTQKILTGIENTKKIIPIVFTSSVQSHLDNPYGRSKKTSEELIDRWSLANKNPAYIFRLPNIFGKWAKANYSSVVATFCFNIAHGKTVEIHNPEKEIIFGYIDDVVENFLNILRLDKREFKNNYLTLPRSFPITLAALADKIKSFHSSRLHNIAVPAETTFDALLYATFISYLPYKDLQLSLSGETQNDLLQIPSLGKYQDIFISYQRSGIIASDYWTPQDVKRISVLDGQVSIACHNLATNEELIIESHASKALEIPPGFSFTIQNIGSKIACIMYAVINTNSHELKIGGGKYE